MLITWYLFFYKPTSGPVNQMVKTLLTHWGRVTHICVGNLTIVDPDNDLAPSRRQAIIWTNAGILLIGPWGTIFSEILIGIHFHSRKFIWICRLRNDVHFVSASMCQDAILQPICWRNRTHMLHAKSSKQIFTIVKPGFDISSSWPLFLPGFSAASLPIGACSKVW